MLAAKRLIQKAIHHHPNIHQQDGENGGLSSADMDLQISIHYGIPSTASLLAFDSVQRLLAIATLDGRIKVIGGDGIEALLVSPRELPYKYIEFLENQGFLVSITNENEIQVWNLESRRCAYSLQWGCNITASSVISGSFFMYIGDEHGSVSVLKYDVEATKLLQLPYHISASSLNEVAGFASFDHQPIVGILPQPCSSGNRLLIAYENGLIVLWDIPETRIIFVGGGKDLQLNNGVVDSQNEVSTTPDDDNSYLHLQEKEISALCWASSNGSLLAVGYVDGDIMFWKTPPPSSSGGKEKELTSGNVVRMQLSSAERRLPVIVLHWSTSNRSSNGCSSQLFIYGGDEIGSEEVLTILTLEWSSGMETLRCTGRLELILAGSFADMVLLPSAGPTGGNEKGAFFVLTNPGQLLLYDDASLSASTCQRERKTSTLAMEYPAVVPISDPHLTLGKFITLPSGGKLSKIQSEIAAVTKHGCATVQASGIRWPLTGGIPSQLSFTEHTGCERMYLAGYENGSIRLWNATYHVLSLICVLEGEIQDIKVAGFGASVSNLEFCLPTLTLAVGNECGLVRIYNLNSNSDETSFRFVAEGKNEDHNLSQGKGPQCRAVFSLLNSPICALQFTNSGAKLAVGFDCGRVAVLDMSHLSILFFTNSVSASCSPVTSLLWIHDAYTHSFMKSIKHSKNNTQVNSAEIIFVLTKDATLYIIDGDSGSMISAHPWQPKKKSVALSMYVVEGSSTVSSTIDEKQVESSTQNAAAKNELMHKTLLGIGSNNSEQHSSAVAHIGGNLRDSLVLLCCKDSLRLYSTKGVIQGNNKIISKVKHEKSCCWASTLKKDDRVCALVLLFQTGIIEIRSFPDLELVKESSLTSILRWKLKVAMENMINTSDDGHIAVANGSELAFISVLAGENCPSTLEYFPCLHDKVVAAAAESAFTVSSNQKKKQVTNPGILSNIMKGFKGGKVNHTMDFTNTPDLEHIFSRPPFPDSSATATASQEDMEINIDDIEIDDPPVPMASNTLQESKNIKRADKGTERERLLGVNDDIKPRLRTPEEIMATYRKAGDASSVAAQTRNKLVERQEKLDRITRRTAELQSGAENFESLANELVKAMENRKWWQI